MNESTVTPLGLSDAEFLDQGPPDLDTAVPEEDASQIETTSESEDSDINDNSEAQEQTDTIIVYIRSF